jgi:PncC family amidohydrolase
VLGVDAALLERTGAVTAEVAAAMAEGALRLYEADLAVSTTGVAGPGPDSRGVPAGTVHQGIARRGMPTRTREVRLSGGRAEIRALAVQAALDELAVELEARPEA